MSDKFKVGDRVVLNAGIIKYLIINKDSVCEVVNILPSSKITVKVIRHTIQPYEGTIYTLNPRHFHLEGGVEMVETEKLMEDSSLTPLSFEVREEWREAMNCIARRQRKSPVENADFAILGKGCSILRTHQPCHGQLMNLSNIKAEFVVSAIYEPYQDKKFYRWMLERSPYRYIIMNDSVNDVFERGLIVRTDVPSNYLLGCLITSRYPWGHSRLIRRWKEFSGYMNQNKAFIAAHIFNYYIKTSKVIGWVPSNQTDETLSINPGHIDKYLIENFLSCKFNNPLENYSETGYYDGVFGLWSGVMSDASSYHPHLTTSLDKLKTVGNTTVVGRGWNNRLTKRKIYSTKQVLSILRTIFK